jgi:hypothetical protein
MLPMTKFFLVLAASLFYMHSAHAINAQEYAQLFKGYDACFISIKPFGGQLIKPIVLNLLNQYFGS